MPEDVTLRSSAPSEPVAGTSGLQQTEKKTDKVSTEKGNNPKPTAATNARDIQGLRSQLTDVSRMLEQIVAQTAPSQTPPQASVNSISISDGNDISSGAPVQAGTFGSSNNSNQHTPRGMQRRADVSSDNNVCALPQLRPCFDRRSSSAPRHQDVDPHTAPRYHDNEVPYRASSLDNRLQDVPRQQWHMPETVSDLNSDKEIQRRVQMLLATNINPLAPDKGRRHFAHAHIVRGKKKVKTGLGELSLPEYTYGLIQVANMSDGETRVSIFNHIEEVNEDSISYDWEDVRNWSEEVCSRISEARLHWSDAVKIQNLRLRLSQITRNTHNAGYDHSPDGYSMNAEVAAARPAPPCRQYNYGNCVFVTDHTSNGFRHLHVCSHSIYMRCQFLNHPERECRIKKHKNEKKRSHAQNQGNETRPLM